MRLPWEALEDLSRRILTALSEVVSITYHIAPKPPCTMEVGFRYCLMPFTAPQRFSFGQTLGQTRRFLFAIPYPHKSRYNGNGSCVIAMVRLPCTFGWCILDDLPRRWHREA
jgi:hypothetical protein